MINLYRTVDKDPKAVLEVNDKVTIFPWDRLLDLRWLARTIPPDAAKNENWPLEEKGAWAISGSPNGIALMLAGRETLYFTPEEWEELGRLLYVGDDLLMQVDIAELIGRPQSQVGDAIARGVLFAFQKPGLKRLKWRIPRRAVDEWLE